MNAQLNVNRTDTRSSNSTAYTLKEPTFGFSGKSVKVAKMSLRRTFNERISSLPDSEGKNYFEKAKVIHNLNSAKEITIKTAELIYEIDEKINQMQCAKEQKNYAKENLAKLFDIKQSQLSNDQIGIFSPIYQQIFNNAESTVEEIMTQTANLMFKVDEAVTANEAKENLIQHRVVETPSSAPLEVTHSAESGEKLTPPPLRMPFEYRSLSGNEVTTQGTSIAPLMYMVAHTKFKGPIEKNHIIDMVVGDFEHEVVAQLQSENMQKNADAPIVLQPFSYLQADDKKELLKQFNAYCQQNPQKFLLKAFSNSHDDPSQPLVRKQDLPKLAKSYIEKACNKPLDMLDANMVKLYDNHLKGLNDNFKKYVVLQHIKRQLSSEYTPLVKDMDPQFDMLNLKLGHGRFGSTSATSDHDGTERVSDGVIAHDFVAANLKPGTEMVVTICHGSDVRRPTAGELKDPSSNTAQHPTPETVAQPIAAALVRSIDAKARELQRAENKPESGCPTTIYASSGEGLRHPKADNSNFERILRKNDSSTEAIARVSRNGLTYKFDLDSVEVYKINEEAHSLIGNIESHAGASLTIRSELKKLKQTKLASVDEAKEMVNKLKNLLGEAEEAVKIRELTRNSSKQDLEITKEARKVREEINNLLTQNKSKFSERDWAVINNKFLDILGTNPSSLSAKKERLDSLQTLLDEVKVL